MLNKLPKFILAQLTQPWGRKFPKRGGPAPWPVRNMGFTAPGLRTRENCTLCGFPLGGEASVYFAQAQYHKRCEPNQRPGRMRDWRQERNVFYSKSQQRSIYEDIPEGNLDDSEYRFWVGCVVETSGFARCRACHKSFDTRADRLKHKIVPVGDSQCTIKLVAAYKTLALKNKCLVCQEQTWTKHWGVPLCNTVSCIKRWMFETTHWTPLELEIMKGDPRGPKIIDAEGIIR